ncbi:unnamed protein product [Hermetia illucens]|uniref:Uncharacterized protein n=1 Tax=Hermetia illucens TaxID=343691 RepID=A0A7R8YN57_HERIL|nr:unnamed protein product [Hermetia illucens]
MKFMEEVKRQQEESRKQLEEFERRQEEKQARPDERQAKFMEIFNQRLEEIINGKEVNEEQKESTQEVACRENEKSQYEGTPEIVEQIAETTKQLRDFPEEPQERKEGPVVCQNMKLVLQKVSNQQGSIQKEVLQHGNANEIPKPMEEMVQEVEKRQEEVGKLQSSQVIRKSQEVISQELSFYEHLPIARCKNDVLSYYTVCRIL